MQGAEGRAGEGGAGGVQGADERRAGKRAVGVRHAVRPLQRTAEKLQAVVPPDLVLVRRCERSRQIGDQPVRQFRQREELVGRGVAVRRLRQDVLLPAGLRAPQAFA